MIRFRTLGRVELEGVERSVARSVLGGPKRLGLLAYLVLDRPDGFHRRDALLPLFWPESDTDSARHALRNTLYELRRSLGGEVVPGRGQEEIGVDRTRLRCDAVAFEDALSSGEDARALEIYGGDLLPGFHVPGAGRGFEEWLDGRRRQLRRQAREAARRLAETAEAEGRADRAAEYARRAMELDPYDEAGLRRLMELLARAGKTAAAVRAYEQFTDRASSELGVRPASETRALAASLRSGASGEEGAGERSPDGADVEARDGGGVRAGSGGGAEELPAGEAGGEARDPAVPGTRGGHDGPRGGDGTGGRAGASSVLPAVGPGGRRAAVAVAAIVVLAGVLGIGIWLLSDGDAGDGAVSELGPAGDGGIEAIERAASAGERVAVFPFRVRGDARSGYLAGGLGTLLSAGLDGAGDLQAVDPRALRGAGEGADGPETPEDAADAARGLGADLFVLGDAVATSGRVHLAAGLYRPDTSPPLARASVEGARDDLFRLVDRLAAELLSARYPEEELPLARRAARATESLPALQAYLEGENRFRTGRFVSAVSAYQRAVEADPEFALAHHRLSVTAEWVGNGELAGRAAERAVEHATRLPPRQRRLLSAHRTSLRGDAAEAERRYREILATYPTDLEAWYQLGEILFHYGPAVGRSIEEARRAFREVAELSPDHVPSLVHLARIAAAEGRAADVSRLAGRVLELVPGSARAWEMRALATVAGEERGDVEALLAGLEDAGDRSVRLATWTVAVFAEDLETAARMAGLLTAPWRSPDARRVGREWRAELAVARGRWGTGELELSGRSPVDPVSAFHAYRDAFLASLPFSAAPDSTVAALRERLAGPDSAVPSLRQADADAGSTELARLLPRLRRFAGAQLAARAGDLDAALAQAADLEAPPEPAEALPLADRLGRIVRARVAWRRENPRRALELLGEKDVETRSSLMFGRDYVQPFERYLRGRVLEDDGRGRDALRWFRSFRHQHVHHLVYLAPSHLRRARILEATGEHGEAAAHYRAFLELWDDPDPELAPTRRAAARELERLATALGGERR